MIVEEEIILASQSLDEETLVPIISPEFEDYLMEVAREGSPNYVGGRL